MTSSTVIAASFILLLTWFRYACRLSLSGKTGRDYGREVAVLNHLQFQELQAEITEDCRSKHLDSIEQRLERDYRIIAALLAHSGERLPLEARLLQFRYSCLKAAGQAVKSRFPRQRASFTAERCRIVAYFANLMGERSLSVHPPD
jgi:hypothetical protein